MNERKFTADFAARLMTRGTKYVDKASDKILYDAYTKTAFILDKAVK